MSFLCSCNIVHFKWVHHTLQCGVPKSCPPKMYLVTLVLGEWNGFLLISRKRGNFGCKCWSNYLKRCPQDTCRAEACPQFQSTFRRFPIIRNHLEISPYPAKVLRQYIYLAATLNLGSRNPKCSLHLMKSNSSFSSEEESILLKENEVCFSWPIRWWHTREASQRLRTWSWWR